MRIEPGQPTALVFDRKMTIEFDRGGGFGTAKYSLSAGDFQFGVYDKGWDLKIPALKENPLPSVESTTTSNPLPSGS